MKGERQKARREMKKVFSKLITAALILVLTFSLVGFAPANAKGKTPVLLSSASEKEENLPPYEYHHVSKDYSKTFTGKNGNRIIVQSYIDRVVLVGFQKGIKKINKTLKKMANNFYEDYGVEGVYETAQFDVENGRDKEIYNDYVYMGVTYMGSKYVSIESRLSWYAGGTGNYNSTGLTFDLKTGKTKTITEVTGLSLDEIKEKFIMGVKDGGYFGNYYDDYSKELMEYVDTLNAKNINYVINSNGQVAIIVPFYTSPFLGGASIEIALDDVYVAE